MRKIQLGMRTALAIGLVTASACGDDDVSPIDRPDAQTADAATDGGGPTAPLDSSAPPLDATQPAPDAAQDAGPIAKRPNILLIVADDLGYSDLGVFGGEISTPNIDALASSGRILTDHHSGFTCAPTRSMLISGTDHHLVGLGRMGAGTGAQAGKPGYEGVLNDRALSIAELLRDGGYHTYIAGKWHLGSGDTQSPLQRGYEKSFVLLPGVSTFFSELSSPPTEAQTKNYREDGQYVTPPADFYQTDFYTDKLISYFDAQRGDDKPFYAFAAYTSPHWPMQAPESFIDRYKGKYDEGYEVIRARRFARQKELGIIPQDAVAANLLPVTAERPGWTELTPEQNALEARRMEIYAAMVENLDWNIGRLVKHLKDIGEYDDTFIFFQSDNGAEGRNADRATANNTLQNLGRPGSYVGVGVRWAEVSATPFRLWKAYSPEGGHSVPAIAHLPKQTSASAKFKGLTHLTDLAPTFLEIAGVQDPGSSYKGRSVHPITGKSLLPVLEERATFVRDENTVLADEQDTHRYVRRGRWKLLWLGPPFGLTPSAWQLYDLQTDRAEINDVSALHPDIVAELTAEWEAYVQRVGVVLGQPGGGGGGGG
ncbi:MAG: arylsulfatase [Polyangiales bacterium]